MPPASSAGPPLVVLKQQADPPFCCYFWTRSKQLSTLVLPIHCDLIVGPTPLIRKGIKCVFYALLGLRRSLSCKGNKPLPSLGTPHILAFLCFVFSSPSIKSNVPLIYSPFFVPIYYLFTSFIYCLFLPKQFKSFSSVFIRTTNLWSRLVWEHIISQR